MDYNIKPNDKERVLNWFKEYCFGFRKARFRAEIISCLQMPDRYFRAIASELIHEGHICSDNIRGYWFKPLVTDDQEEIEAIKHSLLERKSKALSLLEDCDRLLNDLKKMTQGQLELGA